MLGDPRRPEHNESHHTPTADLGIAQAPGSSGSRGKVYAHHTHRIQEAVIDYDSPRRPPIDDDDGLDELKARSRAAWSPASGVDEAGTAEDLELPTADMSGEELTGPVLPIRADELQCCRCFLVQHRGRFTERVNGQDVCLECS
jgi:hypothetical protein